MPRRETPCLALAARRKGTGGSGPLCRAVMEVEQSPQLFKQQEVPSPAAYNGQRKPGALQVCISGPLLKPRQGSADPATCPQPLLLHHRPSLLHILWLLPSQSLQGPSPSPSRLWLQSPPGDPLPRRQVLASSSGRHAVCHPALQGPLQPCGLRTCLRSRLPQARGGKGSSLYSY